ncbi:phosphate ABC transporter permease PstA [Erwinia sp. ErVv1]|uniref:phosphate ABC transporter permease PstA n=1 Tax=Erwinia sp. ErVv1 TaxID=1603299 RepID=UPI0009EEBC73|nr:phosphate ABC transporter permease PstA [Erwinia sp. ErVv1]
MRAARVNHRWRWLTGGAVALCLLAFLALIALLGWQGLSYFWPQPVTLFSVQLPGESASGSLRPQQPSETTPLQGDTRPPLSGETTLLLNTSQFSLLGEIAQSQKVTRQQLQESGARLPASLPSELTRLLINTGSREVGGTGFRSLLSSDILRQERPANLLVLQRRQGGVAFGWFDGLLEKGQPLTAVNMQHTLQQRINQSRERQAQVDKIRRVSMARLNNELEQLAAQRQRLQKAEGYSAQTDSILLADSAELKRQFSQRTQLRNDLNRENDSTELILRDVSGQQHRIPLSQILAAWYPNAMSIGAKWQHFGWQIWHFVSNPPGEGPGNGGVFPAIFGTILMVLLMSVVVMPLGVVAAIWLHEYAGNSLLTRLVRIAVINLAGVPSIVYGVFGLGFFVWMMGGSIDRLFFSTSLPNPTFGTPGLLWASLTLALLTLPVVIVATEEGLSRIPASLRQGSLALGATQAETLWHITLPMAVPAMLTGLILSVARAAGETAPLMLVGVAKMVPELPLDSVFPFLHLDRKFMHLGFQIYDLAFQSPDAQADRPLVFATALLLVLIILALNLLAMILRHRLRERYRALMN